MPKTASSASLTRSLDDFVRAKKQADCPVCKLAAAIRKQIADAREREIRHADILAWLAQEHGLTVTSSELRRHHYSCRA